MSEEKNSLGILFKSGVIGFILSLIGYAIMFFFQMWSARYLGPDQYGLFSLSKTILGLTALIAGIGLANGLPRYIPYYRERDEEGLEKGYTNFVIYASIASSLLFGTILFFLSGILADVFNVPGSFSFLIKIIAIAVPFKVLARVFGKMFLANENVFYQKMSFEIVHSVTMISGLAIVWFLDLGLLYVVGVLLASEAIELLFEYVVYKLKFEKTYFVDGDYEYRRWIYFSLPLLFVGSFGFLINWTDNLVIGFFLEPIQLGIYSVAYSFSNFLTFFRGGLQSVFLPLITKEHSKEAYSKIRMLFRKSTGWIFGVTFPVFLIYAFFSKEILVLIYGNEYAAGAVALIILGFGNLFDAATGFPGSFLSMKEETSNVFYVKFVVSAINVLLNLSLVPYIGIIGAAITTTVSYLLENIIFLHLTSDIHEFSFDFLYTFKIILSGLPAMAMAMWIINMNFFFWAKIVLAGGVYGIVYLIMLYVFRTFDKEDKQILRLILKRYNLYGYVSHWV